MQKILEKDKYNEQTEDKMDAGDTYKKNYNGKTDTKARKEGYATPYTIFKDRNMGKQKLGQWYYISKCIILGTF